MSNQDHTVDLSYDVTVTTTYRVSAKNQPSYTRAKQQIDALKSSWGDDPSQWPESYADLEIVAPSQATWKLNDVARVRSVTGFESYGPIPGVVGNPDLGEGAQL